MNTREKVQFRIAQEAARLMIEEGIESYRWAKLKAIERLGIPNAKRELPRDDAVDLARQEYQRLYRPAASAAHIAALRRLALRIMEPLEAYSPRLVGSVVEGTAGAHSPVIIHVFPDAPEDLIRTLIDLRIPYREGQHLATLGKDRAVTLPAATLTRQRATIKLLVFPPEFLGQSVARKRHVRAQASSTELRRLIGASSPTLSCSAQ